MPCLAPERDKSVTQRIVHRRKVSHAVLRASAEGNHFMVMPAPQAVRTIEELLALPYDGLRHELLAGDHVVTPSPSRRHQRALFALYEILKAALRDRYDLEVLGAPADIRLGNNTLVQPDLFIIERDPANPLEEWDDARTPLLVVEIVSSSTALYDRGEKRQLYLEAGVEEYWIVDARLFERWKPKDDRPAMVGGILDWSLSAGAGGSLDVASFFDRALGRLSS
jgi:Uma2 family endonuclease